MAHPPVHAESVGAERVDQDEEDVRRGAPAREREVAGDPASEEGADGEQQSRTGRADHDRFSRVRKWQVNENRGAAPGCSGLTARSAVRHTDRAGMPSKDMIGRVLSTGSATVTADHVAAFARALGDENPSYVGPVAHGLVAPPTYPIAFMIQAMAGGMDAV